MPRNDLTTLADVLAALDRPPRKLKKFSADTRILESKVKKAVKERLKEIGAYQFWPVQMGLGTVTLDCLGFYQGRGYAVETKRTGRQLTMRQEQTAEKMRAAGAEVFVIDTVEDAENLFRCADEFDHIQGQSLPVDPLR